MERRNIDVIIEMLEDLNPRKAKKLRDLDLQELGEKNPHRRNELHLKTIDYMYYLFTGLLSNESRKEFMNISVGINELCYMLEQQAGDGWVLNNYGAMRIQKNSEGVTIVGSIPREYQKGFILEDRNPQTEQERVNAEKEIDFYTKYSYQLDLISSEIDHKQEFLTYGYQVKNPNTPRALVELLIQTLGLPKIPSQNTTTKKPHTN